MCTTSQSTHTFDTHNDTHTHACMHTHVPTHSYVGILTSAPAHMRRDRHAQSHIHSPVYPLTQMHSHVLGHTF